MPSPHRTAAILSIGDELTLGQGLDTNSQWLSEQLVNSGILPIEHVTVADDLVAIAAAMERLSALTDVVISTGGLGPTSDDLTRHALARAMHEPVVEDEAALGWVRAWFTGRGRPMPEANRSQALRPASATLLRNEWGTAPGLAAVIASAGKNTDTFCLPGPPRETRPMFETLVRPRLRPAGRITTRAILSYGLGESEVAERLGPLMDRSRATLVGTTVQAGVVAVRIRHEGAAGEAAVAEAERVVRDRLGPYVFGADDDSLASVVLALLRERSQTLAVVESCTGGLLGSMITEVPGSSAAFVGGWITYSNAMKTGEVGVPAEVLDRHGAVSRETAEAMARGGLDRSGASWSLSITGIAGPGGGSAEKPVGTVWVSLASSGAGSATDTRRFLIPGERQNVRAWAARHALAMLRLTLVGAPELRLLRQV